MAKSQSRQKDKGRAKSAALGLFTGGDIGFSVAEIGYYRRSPARIARRYDVRFRPNCGHLANLMSYISELLKSALVLPEYRDWQSTKTIVQARIGLLLIVLLLSMLFAVFSRLAFGIGFSLALGLGLAATLDLGFAGGIEAVRRLISSWHGQERAEARRIEKLARINANGFLLSPRFIRGLHQGLWLSVDELERAIGKRILASQARKFGRAVDIEENLWMPVSNAAVLARQVEPLGMQFVSIWLENTALPYWENLTTNMDSDTHEHHQ